MIPRQSLDLRNTKNIPQRKILHQKENLPRTPTHHLSKSKKKQSNPPLNSIYPTNSNKPTDRSRINPNHIHNLNNNISPKKINTNFSSNQKYVNYIPNKKEQVFKPNPQSIDKYCQNHRGKIAKYKIISDQDTLNYCQKCSIFLASQGFSVSKIQNDDANDGSFNPSKTKPSQSVKQIMSIQQLENHVCYTLKGLQDRQMDLKRRIGQAESYKKQIQQNLQIYFSKIIEQVLQKKREFLCFVQSEHIKMIQQYKKQQNEFEKGMMQVYRIKSDIMDVDNKQIDEKKITTYKNQVKKYRIICEKFDCENSNGKKDIVTVDLQQILDTISEKFKIKISSDSSKNDRQQWSNVEQGYRQMGYQSYNNRLSSIGQSQINKMSDKFSLFSSIDNLD